jgi:hypothetical protein
VEKVLPITVQRLRLSAGVKISQQRNRWQHPPELLSAHSRIPSFSDGTEDIGEEGLGEEERGEFLHQRA